MNSFNHVSPLTSDIYTLKTPEVGKVEEELKSRHLESMNYDVMDDALLSRDVINPDINKPIAKRRYARKHSFTSNLGFSKSSLRLCSQTFIFITLILSMIISVVGGLFNVKLPEQKSTVGTSSEPLSCYRFCSLSILFILREFLATIISINGELCFCNNKEMILNNNKQLIRCVKILQTTVRDKEAFCSLKLKRSSKLARPPITNRSHCYSALYYVTLAQNILAGKRSSTYIFPSADFCASQVCYFGTYTINLELEDHFKVLFHLVYLYIYAFYCSWASCNSATYSEDISDEIYTLVYFASKVILLIIKSHNKYQSCILIGLAHSEKASLENRSIFVHSRSYWREWRPLVTPWADCIKEGVEPWECQKWFFLSHVLVSLSLSSLLPLLLCSCFGCYYYYHYCCFYEYVLAKGFYYNSGHGNKPGPKYSNDYGHKPGHLTSKTLLSLSLCC